MKGASVMNSKKIENRRKSSRAERELERRKKRQEMYLDAMDDLAALRDHYKTEVRQKLEEKVKKQRKEREDKKALENEAKEELAQKSMRSFSVHLPKSTDTEDIEFLKKVQLSKFYMVIHIRNHLERNNELDKKYKVDEFNKIIFKHGILKRLHGDLAKGRTITFAKIKDMAQPKSRANDQLSEDKEQKVLESSDKDDISVGMEVYKDKKQRMQDLKSQDVKTYNNVNCTNHEDMFPAIPYPELPTINRNFDSPPPGPGEVATRLKREKARFETEQRKRMVERMFQKSQSYEAATERLMTKFQSLNFQELAAGNETKDIFTPCAKVDDPNDHEVLRSFSGDELLSQTDSRYPFVTKTNPASNIYKYLESLDNSHVTDRYSFANFEEIVDLQEESQTVRGQNPNQDSRSKSLQWKGRVYSDEVLRKQIFGIKDIKREAPTFAPLTMSALEETTHVKVVKGPSKMWINPDL